MDQLSERLQTPISTAELERRWAAVRAAMERDKIDVLLMQNNSDQMGGYVKYFTDLPATNGYPLTVVFPRDDLMTLVSQGPFGGVTELNGKSDGTRRGVKRWYTTPSYSSCYYTAPYDPELAAKALEPYAGGTIGLVGTYQMCSPWSTTCRRAASPTANSSMPPTWSTASRSSRAPRSRIWSSAPPPCRT